MELWVRSQDKECLLKINRVDIDTNGRTIMVNGFETIMGVYKSKQRALEILDEIQEAKLGNFHYKCPSNVKVSIKEDTIVYEMPED